MKKIIIYSLIIAISGLFAVSCQDKFLDTTPTDQMSGEGMLSTATGALVPLNGIYRMLYTSGWSTEFNEQQCDGIAAWNLMADVMGEDMIMKGQGQGWYWFDCIYDVKSAYTSNGWRSYDLWNGWYQIISNANYIIAAHETMTGVPQNINYVVGQAYALRAYAYHNLAMMFARTYKGHEQEPGVPLYTEPSVAGTEGQPRSTLEKTYEQIMLDINKAIELLEEAPAQTHSTHIDYHVANAIKARICLTTNDWEGARSAANTARNGRTPGIGTQLTDGLNSVSLPNVMWGAEMIQSQLPGWGPFLWHMDAFSMLPEFTYAHRAPKCISIPLYEKMGAGDIRREWWLPDDDRIKDADENVISAYIQVKFRFSDGVTALGDNLWMRVEEMYLTEAEALCHQEKYTDAQNLLIELMKTRDPEYTTAKTGNQLSALTSETTGSLLEEILTQRRIELWGEYGRIYDIKRLKQGFKRTAEMGWPNTALLEGINTQDPETYAWVLTIPQSEFDGNSSLNQETDQNPMGDTK